MALTNIFIQEKLVEKFGDQVSTFATDTDILSFETLAANNLKVIQFLYDELGFTFLTDLCGVNYPDQKDAEIDELIEFAFDLDYEKYMEDFEVRQALAVIKDRVNKIKEDEDWK